MNISDMKNKEKSHLEKEKLHKRNAAKAADINLKKLHEAAAFAHMRAAGAADAVVMKIWCMEHYDELAAAASASSAAADGWVKS